MRWKDKGWTCVTNSARVLSRMFTLGPLGDGGRRLQPVIKVFLFLRDGDLHTVPRRWFDP